MRKNIKTLSATALALTCVLGGCGEKAKKIDFEENYADAQAAALSINAVEESAEGFFMSMEMVMDMQMNYQGMDMDMTMEMSLYINHVGDNYYMETVTSMMGETETVGAAVVKDGTTYSAYSWMPDYEGGMEYSKTTVDSTELDEFESMFAMEEDFGIGALFTTDFANIETVMRETVAELIAQDSFEDLPITIGDMNALEISKSATEKGGKKTFKVTAKLPSQVEGEELSIMFGIVVDGETLDSLLMELKGKGTMEGMTMAYDADVTQEIEAKGRTDAKYTSLPKNVTWVEE